MSRLYFLSKIFLRLLAAKHALLLTHVKDKSHVQSVHLGFTLRYLKLNPAGDISLEFLTEKRFDESFSASDSSNQHLRKC